VIRFPEEPPAHWRKSTYSGGNSECVEVGRPDGPFLIGLRDSKDHSLGHIAIPAASWVDLVRNVRSR